MVSGFIVFIGTPKEQQERCSSLIGNIYSRAQDLRSHLYPGANSAVIVKNLDSNLLSTLVELAGECYGTFTESPMFATWEGETI